LTKDQAPKEAEMQQMSEFVTKLEGYADLEVSIIRGTKINKVLKAILKLPVIPNEEEHKFKPRSQSLLDKWNTLLLSEGTPIAAPPPTPTNINGARKPEVEDAKAAPTATSNGTKESSAEAKVEEKLPVAEESVAAPKIDEAEAPAPAVEETVPVSQFCGQTCSLLTCKPGAQAGPSSSRDHRLNGIILTSPTISFRGATTRSHGIGDQPSTTSPSRSTGEVLNFTCSPLLSY
jgi:hypothetical protein